MPIDIEIAGGIATITLNRPEAMNSIDPQMREQLNVIWDRIRTDDDIRVAVITGAGDRAFCTGSDLKNTMPPRESFAELMFGHDNPGTMLHHFGSDKPTICAVNGYAVGGGMELALACDICIASDNAKFGLTEVRVGSVPGSGGVVRLPRTVGKSTAMMLLLTGDIIDATEALRIGMISKVTPAAELMPTAMGIAERIAQGAPLAVRALKKLIMEGLDMPLPTALEANKYIFGLLRDTKDRIEGRVAFKEKRKPKYQGK